MTIFAALFALWLSYFYIRLFLELLAGAFVFLWCGVKWLAGGRRKDAP